MQNHKLYDVIIVGGGASGLMAAGISAGSGAKTLLLEKMNICGRKLRITGKGRCNITNLTILDEFINHIEPDGRFLYQVFSQFFSSELISFFESIGIKTVFERGNRVFPESNKAQDVVEALIKWNKKSGTEIICNTKVEKLLIENNCIKGLIANNQQYYSNSVIIATGGCSYPATGSDGFGYNIAKSAGHTIIPVRPALVPLLSSKNIDKNLNGLDLKNVSVKLLIDGKKITEKFGEMSFVERGISGPIILTVSRLAVDAIISGKKVEISIDLKPALDNKKLDDRLLREINTNGNQSMLSFLKILLPSKLIQFCINICSFTETKKCNQISSAERLKLLKWLKDFRINVTGYASFSEAIVTAGGVNLKEINPKTMESKLIKKLFFAGEILDLNADTGGYNLQIAFSTGWVAGKSASIKSI